MNKLLHKSALRRFIIDRCPHFDRIAKWISSDDKEDIPDRYHVISTSNHRILPYEPKQIFRREQHDLDAVAEHAFLTNELLHVLGLSGWIVRLSRSNLGWFESTRSKDVNSARIAYLRSISARKRFVPHTFCGGLWIDGFPTAFVNLFLDYSFVNRVCDLHLIHLKRPFALRLTHHLNADLITSDKTLFENAVKFYDRSELKRICTEPHVYVNAALSAEEFFGVA